jgi:hypothetical protein
VRLSRLKTGLCPTDTGYLDCSLPSTDIHGLGFQQIQGGQQITILGLRTFGERNSWLTDMVAEFYFILNESHLLASLNLLENM